MQLPPKSEFVKFNPPKHLSRADRRVYKLGAEVYQRESHCATCHLAHGKGNANVYPSLVGSPWVNGSEDRLIKMTLHGLWGKMTVNGKTYDPARGVPPMTAFRSLLKDEELAAVLTFVRNTWGNKSSPITPDSVKRGSRSRRLTADVLDTGRSARRAPSRRGPRRKRPGRGFSNEALEAELLAASPAELAQAAIEHGNAKRGKEVFYQSAAACFACHDPPRGAARLGPDLGIRPRPS